MRGRVCYPVALGRMQCGDRDVGGCDVMMTVSIRHRGGLLLLLLQLQPRCIEG